MTTTVVEELPLFRAKCDGIGHAAATGPNVGPGTYNVGWNPAPATNNANAPFNTTSQRPPLSQSDPRVPGPGRYDLSEPDDVRIGVVSCPFVSESARFPLDADVHLPGPAAYDIQGRFPDKRGVRSHTFAGLAPGSLAPVTDDAVSLGPGSYNPNDRAARRSNPRAAHFSKYSGRDSARVNENPGPASYNPDLPPRSLYNGKPSSMFATNTNRLVYAVKDTPGPGDYEIAGSVLRKGPACTLGRSAFGTSCPRFDGPNSGESPGPGWYTSEIAPRRPKYDGRGNVHPFASTADRFSSTAPFVPGPASYDGFKPSKHRSYVGESPFGSTVPRFGPTVALRPAVTFDEAFGPGGQRRPRRNRPLRAFESGEIKPTTGLKPLPERNYNVKHDWPKPGSIHSSFGAAPRLATGVSNGVPGPGSYIADGSSLAHGGKSSWGREVRFGAASTDAGGTVGPGSYYHDSTFLKKSYNCTIGSDTTW